PRLAFAKFRYSGDDFSRRLVRDRQPALADPLAINKALTANKTDGGLVHETHLCCRRPAGDACKDISTWCMPASLPPPAYAAARAAGVTGREHPPSPPRSAAHPANRCATAMQLSHATSVFGLDGTLVYAAPDLAAATNHALAGAGLEPMAVAELGPFIGYGSR